MLSRQAESSQKEPLPLSPPTAPQWPLAQTAALERTTWTARKLQGKGFAKITPKSERLLLFLNKKHRAHSSALGTAESIFTDLLFFLSSPWLLSVWSHIATSLPSYSSQVCLVLLDDQLFAEKNWSPSSLLCMVSLVTPPFPPYNRRGSKSSWSLLPAVGIHVLLLLSFTPPPG